MEAAKERVEANNVSTRLPDPIGRLFKLWENYFPENTAENLEKFSRFRYEEGEGPSSVYVRLQQLTEQLREQLGPDAINGPDARKKYRSAIREMGTQMYDLLTQRIMEDDRTGTVSTLREISDDLQKIWVTLRRLHMEDGKNHPAPHPANAGIPVFQTQPPEETRLCHNCRKPGHLRSQCPQLQQRRGGVASRVSPKQGEKGFAKQSPAGTWNLFKPYITAGATCEACGFRNHTQAQCFRKHGYPKEIFPYILPTESRVPESGRPSI